MSNWIVVPLIVFAYLTAGSAPAGARDRDHDGLPDRWEERYHISTSKKSGKKDPDHDTVRNRREYKEHINPRKRDTDRDGYDDRAELRAGTNPANDADRPFPNRSSTGVPAGWTPAHTQSTTMTVEKPGAVVQDVLLRDGADLIVEAPDVTIRRVKLEGGVINNVSGGCNNGLLVERTTIEPRAGEDSSDDTKGVLGYGGYTARRVQIWHRSEGFRVGGNDDGCGAVRIEHSFAAVTPPQRALWRLARRRPAGLRRPCSDAPQHHARPGHQELRRDSPVLLSLGTGQHQRRHRWPPWSRAAARRSGSECPGRCRT